MDTTPYERVAELAAVQHGAISLSQVTAAGFTRHQVQSMVDAGRWRRLARGVVAVAGAPVTWEQSAMAAVLARPDAHLAELAAGHVHGLIDAPVAEPVLIVPQGTSSRAPLGRVRRLALPADQRSVVRSLPVTSVARTIVDLSPIVPSPVIRKLVDDAAARSSASVAELQRVCDEAAHVAVAARAVVIEALAVWEAIRPGSPAEARLLRSIDEWGLPEPDRQVVVVDHAGRIIARLDVGWPARRVGLDYDSVEWHGPARWLDDEARHALVVELGWTLLHVGARDLLPSSDLRRRLERLLAAAPVRPAHSPSSAA